MTRSRPYLCSLLLLCQLAFASLAVRADVVTLKPDHPERYVVVKGDTLWDISSRFLRDPWQWPDVWNKNQQIKNPHLIYPGDIITLTWVDGKPQLNVSRGDEPAPPTETPTASPTPSESEPEAPSSPPPGPVVKLDPKVRTEPLGGAIPTVSPDAILPFLTQPLVVDDRILKRAGYVTIGLDGRRALGDGSQFYARGMGTRLKEHYQVFRPGKALRDPDTHELLGYEAQYLADAKLLESGDPAKLQITLVKQEVTPTDRLLEAPEKLPYPSYYPHAPSKRVNGRIISVIGGVAEVGPQAVVGINLGKRDGMEEGHVLRIMRHAGKHRDPVTQRYYSLPDEESGLLMVFRTFDRVSYGLIMRATRPVHLLDAVRTP